MCERSPCESDQQLLDLVGSRLATSQPVLASRIEMQIEGSHVEACCAFVCMKDIVKRQDLPLKYAVTCTQEVMG